MRVGGPGGAAAKMWRLRFHAVAAPLPALDLRLAHPDAAEMQFHPFRAGDLMSGEGIDDLFEQGGVVTQKIPIAMFAIIVGEALAGRFQTLLRFTALR